MSRGSIELVDRIIVTKIVLIRRRFTPSTFEEKIFGFYASRSSSQFRIEEFGDEETAYGNLPIAIINEAHVIHPKQFISFAQALYQPSPDLYILQKAVINSCLKLRDFNRVEEIEYQSRHWLLFNPLKRLREHLNYKKEAKELLSQNISPDINQNIALSRKAIRQFQQLLIVNDQFSKIVQYLCLDYLFEHKNQISAHIKQYERIMQRYKEGIPAQIHQLAIPIISDIKRPEQKEEEPPKKNSEQVLEAIMKTALAMSVVWVPWLVAMTKGEE